MNSKCWLPWFFGPGWSKFHSFRRCWIFRWTSQCSKSHPSWCLLSWTRCWSIFDRCPAAMSCSYWHLTIVVHPFQAEKRGWNHCAWRPFSFSSLTVVEQPAVPAGCRWTAGEASGQVGSVDPHRCEVAGGAFQRWWCSLRAHGQDAQMIEIIFLVVRFVVKPEDSPKFHCKALLWSTEGARSPQSTSQLYCQANITTQRFLDNGCSHTSITLKSLDSFMQANHLNNAIQMLNDSDVPKRKTSSVISLVYSSRKFQKSSYCTSKIAYKLYYARALSLRGS